MKRAGPRVVAGTAKGRVLEVPARGARPPLARVREAVFSMLESRGAVAGARVLDLFAGSGSLGIEALSRGADRAVFVESDASALASLRRNLERLGLADLAEVHRDEVISFLARSGDRWDLAFCDPPFGYARWPELLGRVLARLEPGGVLVARSGADDPPFPDLPTLEVLRERRYGTSVVLVGRRADVSDSFYEVDRLT
ncbi:MAG: methyltransferase [Acidimicrobiales bacterium]|nr:MAG: methyltransferase [Acidimicrobiales bacterium]